MSEGDSAPLVVIGGAEQRDRPGEVLRTFADECGGVGTVAVCGEASQDPDGMVLVYAEALGLLGLDVVELTAADVTSGAWRSILDGAVGLFFTGGSQGLLVERVGCPDFVAGIRRRRDHGLVVAGTSAGASVMGTAMILAGGSETKPSDSRLELGTGFGLLDAVIDQHFAERGRINRLLAAVAETGCLGLGIDEDTAMVVRDGRFRVVGEGSVTVVDGATAQFHASDPMHRGESLLTVEHAVVHVLEPGDGFDLAARTVLAADDAEASAS
jgi:cyanophycinase